MIDAIEEFLPYLWHRRTLISVGLLLLATGCGLVMPPLLKAIIDDRVWWLIAAYAGLWTIKVALPHLYQLLFFPVVNEAIRDLNDRIVKILLHTPYTETAHLFTGEVISAAKRISFALRQFFKYLLIDLLPTTLSAALACVALAVLVGWSLGLAVALWLCGFVLLSALLVQRTWRIRKFAWEKTDDATRVMTEILSHKRELQLAALQQSAGERMSHTLKGEASAWLTNEWAQQTLTLWQTLYLGLGFGALLVWTGVQAYSVGEWVMIQSYLIGVVRPMQTLSSHLRHLIETAIDTQKVCAILKLKPQKKESKRGAKSGIILHNFSFDYGEKPLFVDFSTHITGWTGIAGPIGSGKSTLLGLITGALTPRSGSLEVRGAITTVPQEPILFSGTLFDNLTFGIPTPTREKLDLALNITGLNALVASLKQGVDSPIGEWGYLLSTGQRQLIALTRALLTDTPIILLDEATCHLDPEAEKRLLASLKAVWRDKTVVMVSHRENLSQWVDQIIDLNEIAALGLEPRTRGL